MIVKSEEVIIVVNPLNKHYTKHVVIWLSVVLNIW